MPPDLSGYELGWKENTDWPLPSTEDCSSSSGSRVGGMHFSFNLTQAPQGHGPFWRAPSQRILRFRHPTQARMTLSRLWRLYSSTKTYCLVCADGACPVEGVILCIFGVGDVSRGRSQRSQMEKCACAGQSLESGRDSVDLCSVSRPRKEVGRDG